MLLSVKVLSVLLATAVTALPSTRNHPQDEGDLVRRDDIEVFERDIEGVVYFKRDDVLTPRDMELAKLHGVDIQQMWKHSVMKRADGDDYTIWVHNSYVEGAAEDDDAVNATETSSIERRQQNARPLVSEYYRGESGKPCYGRDYRDDTGPAAPYTGGISHMAKWAEGLGYFYVRKSQANQHGWVHLLVSGSNTGSGNNALYQVKLPTRSSISGQFIMNYDIRDPASQTVKRFSRQFGSGGAWRARGWGAMWCEGNSWDVGVNDLTTWWSITNTPRGV